MRSLISLAFTAAIFVGGMYVGYTYQIDVVKVLTFGG